MLTRELRITGPLWGESTGEQWFYRTLRANNLESVSMLRRYYVFFCDFWITFLYVETNEYLPLNTSAKPLFQQWYKK